MESTLIVIAVLLGLLGIATLIGLIAMALGHEFVDGFFGFFRELILFIGDLIGGLIKGCASTAVLLLGVAMCVGFLIMRL